jgi:hypothetical protein
MLADPCGAQLYPGIYGDQEGLMARLRSSEQASLVTALNCGYVIWFPDYHNEATDVGSAVNGPANLFVYSETDPSQIPLDNVTATPMGYEDSWTTKTTSKSLQGLPDPAAAFLATDMVQDARLLSACLSLTYTGKMQDSSGELCVIENFPVEALIASIGSAGGIQQAPSVNQMFNYSTRNLRFGTDTHEVLSRPGDASHFFKGASDAVLDIQVTEPPFKSFIPDSTRAQAPRAIGFAWRGLTPDIGDTTPLTFTFTKNVEWRPKVISGLTHSDPLVMHPQPLAHKTAGFLDKKAPGWTSRVTNGLASTAGRLANAAFTGVANNPDLARSIFRGMTREASMLGRIPFIP